MMCNTGTTFMTWVRFKHLDFVPYLFGDTSSTHWLYVQKSEKLCQIALACSAYFNATMYYKCKNKSFTNDWFHIAWVCPPQLRGKSGKPQIYVQGKRYKVIVESRNMRTERKPFGDCNVKMLEGFYGDIDEVLMWHRVIPPRMIKSLYKKQNHGYN